MKIGIMLPIAGRPDDPAPGYTTIRELAQRTEAIGLDSIWLADHFLYRTEDQPPVGFWESWTLLTALAEATTRVEVGTLVVCTAFRNPAFVAKMATTLDEVSGGRLILGLGAGWHKPEFDATGIQFEPRVDRFEEAIKIIAPLVREGAVDFTGTHYAAPDCVDLPRGPRAGGPPILFGAFGPRMLRLTARHADQWNTCWLGQPTALDEPLHKLHAACADEGRDPATLDITVGVVVVREPRDPGQPPPPDKALFGSTGEIVAGLRGYESRGVKHLICNLIPNDLTSLNWFEEIVRAYRGS
jgi:alkanesulfonate monooxygenase SsuD/methylene tetrahydromethanopterin reductase-like flavin-dependent oxidoreductase (luciferase family)